MEVVVTVYKDRDGFYPDGCQRTVSCNSVIAAAAGLNNAESESACVDFGELGKIVPIGTAGSIPTVRLMDNVKGILFVSPASVNSFKDECACCTGSGGDTGVAGLKIEGFVGDEALEQYNILDGETDLVNEVFAGHDVLVYREYVMNPGVDPGDGSTHHNKVKASDTIQLSDALSDGDYICIIVL